MKVIGLTGGICSGKSTLAKLLENRYGIAVIDADKLGHEVYVPGTRCFDELITLFGPRIVAEDGQINRRELGGIVFSDVQKMKELQALVWPHIREKITDKIEELKQVGTPVVLLEAAVMIEAGWEDIPNVLWVTKVDKETAIQRLMTRNNFSPEEAENRVNAQISNEERCAKADKFFDNSLDQSSFEAMICAEYEALNLEGV